LGWPRGNTIDITAVILFTAAMIAMFLASTLYHAIQHAGAKNVFRILDHSMIYIFIAGTYSPFCLSALKGVWGWSLFAAEWSLAALGIILYASGNKAIKKIEVGVYILMGWAIIAGFVPLLRSVPLISVILLVTGGIAYTVGTIWYRKKHIRGTHIIWHSFVLLGTICHWFSIWFLR
jgi:hemolysin III